MIYQVLSKTDIKFYTVQRSCWSCLEGKKKIESREFGKVGMET